jgi:hypothetical protein
MPAIIFVEVKDNMDKKYMDLSKNLQIDCEKCSGLCCVTLYCMKTDGFPANKEAGKPCMHLMPDFRCAIHSNLASKNMKGCMAYDCFGAGQKTTQLYQDKGTWKANPKLANEIYEVFMIVFQLHQMLWYIVEAYSLTFDESLKSTIDALISENEHMTQQSPDYILHLDINKYRLKVNEVLKQVTNAISVEDSGKIRNTNYLGKNFRRENLDGRDFSMCLMIAANLEGCSLKRANFLGADLRDANVKNTDLSASVFLTQMQINAAKGNLNTKIPNNLSRPSTWQ